MVPGSSAQEEEEVRRFDLIFKRGLQLTPPLLAALSQLPSGLVDAPAPLLHSSGSTESLTLQLFPLNQQQLQLLPLVHHKSDLLILIDLNQKTDCCAA